MTWSTPKTWAVNEQLTAALFNAQFRDLLNHLYGEGGRPPEVVVRANAVQSIPNNVFTALTFQVEERDTDNMWSSGAPTRITATRPGSYVFVGGCEFGTNNTNIRAGRFRRSDGTLYRAQVLPPTGGTAGSMILGARTIQLTAGQYVEFQVYQNSGIALDTANMAENAVYFEARKIGDP